MSLNFLEYFKSKPPKLIADRYRLLERLSVNGCEQTLLALDLHAPGHPRRILKELQLPLDSASDSTSEIELIKELFESDTQTLAKLGDHHCIPKLIDCFEGNLAVEPLEESASDKSGTGESDAEESLKSDPSDPLISALNQAASDQALNQTTFYLVQPFVKGHSLEEILDMSAPWSDQEVVAFLNDVLDTLEFIHQHRALHLNLQPSSLIQRDFSQGSLRQQDRRLIITNFGAFQQTSARLISPVPTISTPPVFEPSIYMPDEQMAGHPRPSSDVYAVGMIAIQALTGQRLDTSLTHSRTRDFHWQSLASLSHPALLALLDYMVQDNFRTRCQTAAEALNALSALPPELTWSGLPAIDLTPLALEDVDRADAPPIDYSSEDCLSIEESYISIEERFARQDAADLTTVAYERTEGSTGGASRRMLAPLGVGLIALFGVGAFIWQVANPTRLVSDAPADVEQQTTAQRPEENSASPLLEPELEQPALEEIEATETATEAAAETATGASASESGNNRAATETGAIASNNNTFNNNAFDDNTFNDNMTRPTETAAIAQPLTSESATATVNSFYDYVSTRSWDAVRSLLSEELAQQLEPNFFYQFQDVSVENLRIKNRTADTIDLVVQNTYVYLDGSFQQEERNYTVKMIGNQPTIVDTSFVEVLKDRSYSN